MFSVYSKKNFANPTLKSLIKIKGNFEKQYKKIYFPGSSISPWNIT